MSKDLGHIVISTDGGCRNNQAKDKSQVIGGWGVVLNFFPPNKNNSPTPPPPTVKELRGGKRGYTSNNEMELTAIFQALSALKRYDIPTEIRTDSEYSVNVLTKWRWSWERNGWRNSKGQQIANKELVIQICNLYSKLENVKITWTKGHASDAGNIRADALANMAMDEYSRK